MTGWLATEPREFPLNPEGRDLVVGDVHGCFDTLERALADLAFDPRQDRLFGVGDLVDRGPRSDAAVEWLERRFAAVARGNHDQMVLYWLVDGQPFPPPDEAHWAADIAPDQLPRWICALDAMPLALTIQTVAGPVGVVHAESPDPTWETALARLEARDVDAIGVAMLGFEAVRDEPERLREQPVQGLQAVVHGHEVVESVRTVANWWYIDTGAGFSRANRLSVIEISAVPLRWWTFDVHETVAA